MKSGSSDISLIALVILNNDHKAYGKLVTKYQSDVRGLLIRLTNGDKALADDLAQDVFIRAYKYLKSYKATANFSTWLYRISYNVFNDNYKSRMQTSDIGDYDFISEANEDVSSVIDLENALKILKQDEKVVVLLHYEKGYSHSEIAKILQMPLGTVKTNILRAKEKLKKYYNYEEH
jgi:RNA polymerase sigma-70 factor (ECF subfamily)